MNNLRSISTRHVVVLAAVSLGVSASAQSKMPVYQVTSPLVTQEAANTLNESLGARGDFNNQFIYSIANRQGINLVPQKFLGMDSRENEDGVQASNFAVDVDGLKRIKTYSKELSLSRVQRALDLAKIKLPGTAFSTESTLKLHDKEGRELVSKGLETIVSYQMSLNGVPLTGPGFKSRFSFAPNGELTQGHVFGWNLKRGQDVDVISAADALKEAKNTFAGKNVDLKTKMVYFAPSADFRPKYLFPHYEISGTMKVDGQTVELRKMFVPAAKSLIQAKIDIKTNGDIVEAKPVIEGGRAPYRIQWSSATTDLIHANAGENNIRYQVEPRRGLGPVEESLRLIVTDADGVQVVAKANPTILMFSNYLTSQLMANIAAPTAIARKVQPGRFDGAIEWIDWTNNANNCRNEMVAKGLPVQFFWGEMSAWEQDFKKESAGGDDSSWMDDVDITFYTGHANGDGFVFKSAMDDDFLHFNDASWGEREAEWLVIAACGPLQPTEGGRDLSRWLPAFKGLHILMGYGNVSYDSSQEGSKFMSRILRNNSPMRIRDAWISTATEEQPSDVLLGLMGPLRDDWVWNWDDFFWGKGAVGPDIPASRIIGYWYYVVPC